MLIAEIWALFYLIFSLLLAGRQKPLLTFFTGNGLPQNDHGTKWVFATFRPRQFQTWKAKIKSIVYACPIQFLPAFS